MIGGEQNWETAIKFTQKQKTRILKFFLFLPCLLNMENKKVLFSILKGSGKKCNHLKVCLNCLRQWKRFVGFKAPLTHQELSKEQGKFLSMRRATIIFCDTRTVKNSTAKINFKNQWMIALNK